MEIGIAQRPARNEKVCGDKLAVIDADGTLVAIADGLGHGPRAAEASEAFVAFMKSTPGGDLEDLLRRASDEIARTRGVAGALIRVDARESRMSFVGVGNIEMQAVSRNDIHPVCTPGIVGKRIRKIMPFEYEIFPGDLLAVFSDGISSRLSLKDLAVGSVQEIADRIMAEHGKDHDDATCIVIRFGEGR